MFCTVLYTPGISEVSQSALSPLYIVSSSTVACYVFRAILLGDIENHQLLIGGWFMHSLPCRRMMSWWRAQVRGFIWQVHSIKWPILLIDFSAAVRECFTCVMEARTSFDDSEFAVCTCGWGTSWKQMLVYHIGPGFTPRNNCVETRESHKRIRMRRHVACIKERSETYKLYNFKKLIQHERCYFTDSAVHIIDSSETTGGADRNAAAIFVVVNAESSIVPRATPRNTWQATMFVTAAWAGARMYRKATGTLGETIIAKFTKKNAMVVLEHASSLIR